MSLHNKITLTSPKNIKSNDVVICYGHFNLIHPGHLRYLEHAKTLSNQLFVAIKSDKELDKLGFGDHFSEIERAESVAHIEFVDRVIILNQISLHQLILDIKPKALVLGKEFEAKKTNEVKLAIENVTKFGRVVYHAGETHYASTRLLHDNVSNIENSNINKFRLICKQNNITSVSLNNIVQNFSNSNILVIGDTIIDNYVACDAVGMSAEAPVLVVEELENREYIGGAAVVASHVKALGAECKFISVLGEDNTNKYVQNELKKRGIDTFLIIDPSRPTTYKTRYIVENQKLFRVSRIKKHKVSKKIEDRIIKQIKKLARDLDAILISDFVYGLVTPDIVKEITAISEQYNIKLFGDLQCSSQSGNVSKFHGFDLITPTEKEARIALDDNESGIEWVANTLLEKTNSKNILMKLGSEGFIAYSNSVPPRRENFPALTLNPVDVTGAGDSLFAAMSVALSADANLIEASAIGACMASLSVRNVGNIPITNVKLLEQLNQILI